MTLCVNRQWQGAGRPYQLVESLDRYLAAGGAAELARVPVELPVDSSPGDTLDNVQHLAPIERNLRAQLGAIRSARPTKPLTLACECAGDVAPISWCAELHGERLIVLWIDAHGDLNTPESSPSGEFHGMPLRLLLGEGHADLVRLMPTRLVPHQVVLVGQRDLDPPEEEFIRSAGIARLHLDDEGLAALLRTIEGRPVYLHLDLDVLDPARRPMAVYRVPGGPDIDGVTRALEGIARMSEVVGVSVSEYNDPDGAFLTDYRAIVDHCAALLA